MHTCVYLLRVHMTKNTYMYKIHICICKYTPGLSRCIFTRGCIFAHVQINFYIYAIAFTCPKIHPGANYTYMYNIHPVCKSAHVNGALLPLFIHYNQTLTILIHSLHLLHLLTLLTHLFTDWITYLTHSFKFIISFTCLFNLLTVLTHSWLFYLLSHLTPLLTHVTHFPHSFYSLTLFSH